jgi:hypothetical protein
MLVSLESQALGFDVGDVEFPLQTSLAIRSSWRTDNPAPENSQNIDGQNGNADDANRNYAKGDAYSQTFSGSNTLKFKYENYGGTISAKYWYDSALANNSVDHGHGPTYTPTAFGVDYSNAAGRLDDSDFDDLNKAEGFYLMDAFVYGEFEVADMDLDVRLGRQVLNWGESTFIPGGLSQAVPFDAVALKRPGAQIKDAYLPVNMAFASIGLTEDVSLEAFYQLEYTETNIAACGTYWSTNDFISNGCNTLLVQDGLLRIDRNADGYRPASDDGQFGAALRLSLGEVDYGIYAMNIHSRTPSVLISKSTSDPASPAVQAQIQSVASGLAFQSFVEANPALAAFGDYTGLSAAAAGPTSALQAQASAVKAGIDSTVTTALTVVAQQQAGLNVTPTDAQQLLVGSSFATVNSQSSEYHVFNEEDNQIFGLTFSRNVGAVALSGEISHEKDYGLQINGVSTVFLALSGLSVNPELTQAYNETEFGEDLEGIREFDLTKAQMTAIVTFDQLLGASSWLLIGEVAMTHYHDFSEGTDEVKFGRADIFGLYDPSGTIAGSNNIDDGFITQNSWGYRTSLSGTYNNVFSGFSLKPTLSISHDVEGYSQFGFVEDNIALGLTVEMDYQNTYKASVSYVDYDGGDFSLQKDKDYASVSLGVVF